jgi:outer membrane protein
LPQLYAEGNWYLARQNGASGPDWDALLGLDLPLFKGGAQLAKLKAAEAGVKAAELRLGLAKREATREARQAWRGLKQALARSEATRAALEAAEKSLQDQQKDFRNSLVTQLEMLQAFQTVENARLDNVNARYDAHRARLRLQVAVGAALD